MLGHWTHLLLFLLGVDGLSEQKWVGGSTLSMCDSTLSN